MIALKISFIAVLSALGLDAAAAQTPLLNDAAKAVVGAWEFSNADRDRRCAITLKSEAAAGSLKLELDRGCAGVFPFMKDVAGWTLAENDFLRLVDAKGKAILEFSQVEDGMYEAPRPGEGILFLQTAASVNAPKATADQMVGDWKIVRGSQQLCVLTLSNTPAREDSFALRLKPNCDFLVTRFGPSTWEMDRGELVLKNTRDQTWRFETSDAKTWQRVPESANPIQMVRQ
jgi:hypothetical protein